MAGPLAGGAVILGLLFYAHSIRFFSRFKHGVFLSASATIVAVCLVSSWAIGKWGYAAARHLMRAELTVSLDNVATIIEHQLDLMEEEGLARLTGLSTVAAPFLEPGADTAELTRRLADIQRFNPRYLELDVVDTNGRLIASSGEDRGVRPAPDRIATAFNLEGKTFVSAVATSAAYKRETMYLGVPVKDAAGTVVGALGTLFDVQAPFEAVIHAARFNQSGRSVLVGPEGRILAHTDPARIGEDLSNYPPVVEGLRRPSGEVVAANEAGELRSYHFKQVRNPQTVNPKPWILLVEIDEAEALKPLQELRDELAAGVAIVMLLGLGVAWSASRSLGRPLHALEDLAQAVEGGDLSRTSGLPGRDAFARLGASLDRMTKGLQERDRVKDVFGRYIAKQAAERLLSGDLDLAGEAKRVTIVFSDIRGFTSMAETMTPEQVVTFLNAYFSEMVDAVMEQGGMLDKYLGDGMMAVFGSFGDQPDHARRAVVASLRMKALLAKINGERAIAGKPPIAIGIGIHTDDVIVGNIGSKQRLEFTHIGDGVNIASRVQALNKEYQTTLLITGATLQELGGEFETRPVADVTLRGKSKIVPIYEVLSSALKPAGV